MIVNHLFFSYFVEKERHDAVKFYLIANKWFNKVILLCREWNLIVDKVRLRYVSDLFLFGCDPLAEEVISFELANMFNLIDLNFS